MQTPIALSPGDGRPGGHPIGRGRRLARLLAGLLDRTGLTGWRLVGAVALVIGVLWAATVVLFPVSVRWPS